MEPYCIDYRDTGAFSPAVISYLGNDERLNPFFACRPTISGIANHLEQRHEPADRTVLTGVLREQYAGLHQKGEVPVDVIQNIDLLQYEGSFTITTGHQLNIFTGPLFFIYKIVSAINLAKRLSEDVPRKRFIPLYWMATEDHDFAEIDHLSFAGEQLRWDESPQGATGRMKLNSIAAVLSRYIRLLGDSHSAAELSEMLERAYTREETLAGATRSLVNSLFGKYGLVVIDADDKRLKKLFAPYILRDLTEKTSFAKISESTAALEKAGFKAQVHPREVNFFYLANGLRERIEFHDGYYSVLNSTLRFSRAELEQEVASYPERFSPNVMLRPLYQEVILPNLAYIGGGAEVVYWLQLKQLFNTYHVDFPALILRNSALLLSNEDERILREYALTVSDLFLPEDELVKRWVMKHTAHDLSVQQERATFTGIFRQLENRVSAIDPTLGPSSAAIAARLHHALDNLERKLVSAEKRNQTGKLKKLIELRHKLFPGNSLQERKDNIGSYYAKYGSGIIEALLQHLDPLDFKFTVLTLGST